MSYVWKITYRRLKGKTFIEHEEYVVARHIDDVWSHTALDRADQGVEFTGIVRCVPVLPLSTKEGPRIDENR